MFYALACWFVGFAGTCAGPPLPHQCPSTCLPGAALRGPPLLGGAPPSLDYGGDGPQCSPEMVPLGLKAMVTTPGPWPIVTDTCSTLN